MKKISKLIWNEKWRREEGQQEELQRGACQAKHDEMPLVHEWGSEELGRAVVTKEIGMHCE